MRYFSVAQAQQFDRLAQEKYGVASLILMENAGRGVAEEAERMLRNARRVTRNANIVVICGAGNNGGDGLVAARYLLNAGKKVKVFLLGKASKLKPDPKANINILKKMKQPVKIVGSLRDLEDIKSCVLIIDAIFGIGLKSEVKEPYAEVIRFLNRSKKPVLAIDVPSGLDADTGRVLGVAVKARRTVTFVAPKRGFSRADGPSHCGKIIVRDIGIA